MSTAATGHLHGLFTDVHVLYWDTHGFIFHECSKKLLEMKNSKSFFFNTYYICGHFVKAKYTQFSHPEDAGLHTGLPAATRRLPDVYGCIRWLHGYSRMYTVAIRRFPNVYGGYTETPECIRWLYGDSRMYTVATRRYTAPTRSDTDHSSSVYSGTKNCAGLIFSPDMPDHAGSCRTTPDAFPVSTRMMPERTRIIPDLNPGWSGMRSVNVWKPFKG